MVRLLQISTRYRYETLVAAESVTVTASDGILSALMTLHWEPPGLNCSVQ